MLFSLFVSTRTAHAQGAQSTPKRVIHVWVDPHYGSDSASAGAPWFNPRCTGGGNGCNPTTECKPNDVILTTGQVLLHAPWPFKTINQSGGALSYLPASFPFPGPVSWEYAIIHLLPGLYARSNAYLTASGHNPDNGLQPNNEKFPIHLPPHVSVQGTSALNTVFDVSSPSEQSVAGPAFEFGVSGATGVDSFIDSIAIFGANTDFPPNTPPLAKTFTAIAIGGPLDCSPTISNCFLYGNGIGVLVDTKIDAPTGIHDRTKLFNNTLAFNHVGLWNGDTTQTNNLGTGISKLILVNNIFDSSPEAAIGVNYPTNWAYDPPTAATNNAGFEGIDLSDLQVSGTPAVDSNAYETGRFNNVAVAHPLVNLPGTAHRTTPVPATPTHDIAPYTRGLGVRRGILFVRDALTKPVFVADAGGSAQFDQSPHDFRLNPSAALANDTPQAPSVLNPLVNAGWGGTFPMSMANGLTVANLPGYLSLGVSNQNSWAFHNWNFDCEGYGNPRFQPHRSFFGNSGGFGIDIGADELGQLLTVGYRFGTTSFMRVLTLPSGANVMDNKYQWFLGPPTGSLGGVTVPAPGNVNMPYFRAVDHMGAGPANYTTGTYYAPWFSTWNLSNASTYYFPTVADITPHLLDDFHPWWNPPSTLNLSNAANSIWQSCIAQFNPWLYSDPSSGRVNPAGAYKGNGTNYQWLDLTWTVTSNTPLTLVQQFNVVINFRNNQAGVRLRQYDNWGRGYDTNFPSLKVDTYKPTYAFASSRTALRYCLESKDRPAFTSSLNDTNLQSHRVLVQGDPQ